MFFIIDSKEARAKATRYVAAIQGSPTMCVEIKPYKKSRSQSQNRLLWLFYGVIAQDIGCTPEDLHEQMKVRVLGVEKKVILGQAIIMPKSSTNLTVEEMTNFIMAVEALAGELGIILPTLSDDYNVAYGR